MWGAKTFDVVHFTKVGCIVSKKINKPIDSYRFPMFKNIPEDSKSLIKANGFTGWDE